MGVTGRHRVQHRPVSYPDQVTDGPDHDQPIDVGIVVPTLGDRPEFISESVTSIRMAGRVHITVVKPSEVTLDQELSASVDDIVDDPGRGLAAAINTGLTTLPDTIRYVSWLGDDDRLTPGTIEGIVSELDRSGASAVYGRCRYIDVDGNQLWMNRSGRFAAPLMLFGPQLVPQPGSLLRRVDVDRLGGLDETLRWAFDLDLLLRLRREANGIRFMETTVAEFRWHSGSLSVGGRRGSVNEASVVRRRHLPRVARPLSLIWEAPLRLIILLAGRVLDWRAPR